MADSKGGFTDTAAEIFVSLLGWTICMSMAVGSYFLGRWAAPHIGGAEHSDAFGILSAISTIWLYEHRVSHERWERLKDILQHQFTRLHED